VLFELEIMQKEESMAKFSESTDPHEHQRRARDHHHNPHDWDSPEYVSNWAKGQDEKENQREQAFGLLADTIPYENTQAIKILDLGAGYGALTRFLLERFPKATAVCQDGSEQMAKLGRERMRKLTGRFSYAICDFSRPGWSESLSGPFEAVVSSIAIHNVGSRGTIRRIYEEAETLVGSGGCFLNFDRHRPPIADQMEWLRNAGFKDVQCFWQNENRALFGGFKK
jgi:SAM-dependent methyltransferase